MGISVKEIVTGRKTFFITPDTSLLPESYLEDFFAYGYECYFINNDKRVSITKKVEVLLSLFEDAIFFFNIDYNIQGLDWPVFIRNVIRGHDKKCAFGVLYAKRQSKDEKIRNEYTYLYEMELNCGCIQLEYQKKQNFDLIQKVLFANQAQGRRKNIRAICTQACTFSFGFNGSPINGVLQDISLSHFSFISPYQNLNMQLYEKINDIHFNIRGFLFRSDAVLLMKRSVNGQELMVLTFVSSTGANGLDNRIKQLLIPNMYKLMASNCMNLLNIVYNKFDSDDSITQLEEVDDDLV